MIGWIWRMVIGRFSNCDHQWIAGELVKSYVSGDDMPVKIKRVMKCTKCGDIKTRSL